jgi:Flp pilus assembly pilin Flp
MSALVKAMGALKQEQGQGLVEYALIIIFIAILLVAAMIVFKDELVDAFEHVATTLDSLH